MQLSKVLAVAAVIVFAAVLFSGSNFGVSVTNELAAGGILVAAAALV